MDGRDIRKYIKLVLRWWWLLVVSTVVPMAVSYYFASQQPDYYQAKATIMVGTSLQNPDPDPWQMNLSNTLAAAYADLIKQGPFVEAVIERLGLERTPEQLAGQIQTELRSGAQLLEIYVTDTNPDAAALIANALADELIRRSPASGGSDPEQQEFIHGQLEELQAKIDGVSGQIGTLTASLSELTSAAEIAAVQDRITALEEAKSTYQATYADLLNSYSAESPNALTLFDPAVVPQWPIPNKIKLFVAVAGVVGLGLALGAVFLIDYLDTSVRWEGDGVESILDLPVLGAVPQAPRTNALAASNPLSPVAESVRAVRANVFLLRPDDPFQTLLLTSPGSSEGKSVVLANLAVALASAGERVIALDADMRRPSLHDLFDRPNVVGLADVLSDHSVDGADVSSVPLQDTEFEGLWLLSAGRPPTDPATLLTSPRLSTLLDLLRERVDVILIDSPPVLGPPDATVLATRSDGTILVISAGQTKRQVVERSRDRLLGQAGADLLGLVINRVNRRGSYYHSPAREKRRFRLRKRETEDRAWLTLSEAKERLGISKDQARRWVRSGRLPATRKVLWWQVERDGVERIVEGMREIKAEA